MDTSASYAPVAEFKDRRAGLIVFGILTLLMGLVFALFVPLMIFAMMVQPEAAQTDTKALVPAAITYGLLAIMLSWLGIGSMMARRWARALMLIFSWSWLLVGIFTVAAMAFFLPTMMSAIEAQPGAAPMPEEAKMVMMVITFVMMGGLMVVLPAVWLFFYRSPHVKATCEARDPVRRWTDACPLPVLAVCLWLGFGAATTLLMPVGYGGVLPFFGEFLTGAAGTAGYLVLGAAWAWSAWALYRLKPAGWWLAVGTFCLMMVSHIMTYMRHDVMELYVLMGYSGKQLEEIGRISGIMGGYMVWMPAVFMVPFLAYMIYVKKFLRGGQGADDTAS